MKQRYLFIYGFLLLPGICFLGVFGIPVSVLTGALWGVAGGIYKKDKALWRFSLRVLAADLLCIILFFVLLRHSGM